MYDLSIVDLQAYVDEESQEKLVVKTREDQYMQVNITIINLDGLKSTILQFVDVTNSIMKNQIEQ